MPSSASRVSSSTSDPQARPGDQRFGARRERTRRQQVRGLVAELACLVRALGEHAPALGCRSEAVGGSVTHLRDHDDDLLERHAVQVTGLEGGRLELSQGETFGGCLDDVARTAVALRAEASVEAAHDERDAWSAPLTSDHCRRRGDATGQVAPERVVRSRADKQDAARAEPGRRHEQLLEGLPGELACLARAQVFPAHRRVERREPLRVLAFEHGNGEQVSRDLRFGLEAHRQGEPTEARHPDIIP